MLTSNEHDALAHLEQVRGQTRMQDDLMWNYLHLRQRLKHIGMALPSAQRTRMQVISNWCRVLVEGTSNRQQIRSVRRVDDLTDDLTLKAIRARSNFDQQLAMFNRDRLTFGRAIFSAFPGEDGSARIRAESPREMAVEIDEYREVIARSARFYGSDLTRGTLYMEADAAAPSRTIHVRRERYGHRWVEVERDEYDGPLPLFLHLNRRETGSWAGESQLVDLIPIQDAAGRSLTLMGYSQDAHGFPKVILKGVEAGDFVDGNGNLIPRIEAYFNTLTLLKSKDAGATQLTPADLKNFDTALDMYGRQASSVTTVPAHYFGILPRNNPSSEGALSFEEQMFVQGIEQQNREVGTTLGWLFSYARELETGEAIPNNAVQVDWHNPATPTVAQRMDAIVKARQVGLLSREGAWDEMGWSEPRKAQERTYFEAEANDPALQVVRDLMGGNVQPDE